MTASACGAAHTTQGPADGVLLLLWRRVACAAVTLLYLHCRDVHLVYKQHKDNRQVCQETGCTGCSAVQVGRCLLTNAYKDTEQGTCNVKSV